MLSNSARDATDAPCPDTDAESAICANYVRFSDKTPISWPLHLLPLESEIIFTRDPKLMDSDADGIADFQDSCPHTTSREVTNSAGCSLTQMGG